MGLSTIKMSAFTAVDPNNTTNYLAGVSSLSGGTNIRSPLTTTWTTATRPSSPYDGLLGYNTTLEQWEYWQLSSSSWIQFLISADVNWSIITATSVTAVVNQGYITNRAVTAVQITLPATFKIGDSIYIMGLGAAGWSLVCNTGQTIKFGSSATSVDGSISSDITNANIEVKGLVADTTWSVWSCNSNPTIL